MGNIEGTVHAADKQVEVEDGEICLIRLCSIRELISCIGRGVLSKPTIEPATGFVKHVVDETNDC